MNNSFNSGTNTSVNERAISSYRINLSTGDKVILYYIFFTYILPLIGNLIFYEELSNYTIYKRFEPSFQEIIYLSVILILYWVLRILLRIKPYPIKSFRTGIEPALNSLIQNRLLRYCIAAFVLCSSLIFILGDYSDYRYASEGISSRSSLLPIMIVITLASKMYFFWRLYIFIVYSDFTLKHKQLRLLDITLAISYVLASTGVMHMLIGLFFLIFSIFPNFIYNIMYRNNNSSTFAYFMNLRILMASVVFILLSVIAWVVGQGLKSGSIISGYQLLLNTSGLYEFVLYLIERVSASYYSWANTIHESYFLNSTDISTVAGIQWDTFLYRINTLLNNVFEISKPEISSLSRLNYIDLAMNPVNPREGTSPGLLGSINYISASIYISPIVSVIYMLIIATLIDKSLIGRRYKLSPMGIIFLVYFYLVFFESPFDMLVIIDDAVIHAILLITLSYSIPRKQRQLLIMSQSHHP